MIPYEGGRVYGPYTRKNDNRQHVIILFPDGTRLTVSYPKYLIEIKLGKYLEDYMEVHHVDGDVTNNEYDNLIIVHETVHRNIEGKEETWMCAYCGKPFIADGTMISRRKNSIKRGKSKTGPFCSRSCQGKVNN